MLGFDHNWIERYKGADPRCYDCGVYAPPAKGNCHDDQKFRIKRIVKHTVKEFITLVDEQDAHLLRTSCWTILNKATYGNSYVGRIHRGEAIMLHQVIMDSKPGQSVWHVNGDTLDNRRENLLLRGVGTAEEVLE